MSIFRQSIFLIAILVPLLWPGTHVSASEPLRYLVTDREGNPVPDAVILLENGGQHWDPGPQARAIIDQKEKTFNPHVLVIAPGTEVAFPNSDDTRHHVYSFSDAKTFELRLYRANEAPPVKFEDAGIVSLGCNIHDNMAAYLYITDNPRHGVTDRSGRATVGTSGGPEPTSLRVWHPQMENPLILTQRELFAPEREGRIQLPIRWVEPQQGREINELENLLKAFKR